VVNNDQTGAERRIFSRVPLEAKTVLHQGASSWDVILIDISLNGLAISIPEDWDADYNQSFTADIELEDGSILELYTHLVHVEPDSLGFQCEHVDSTNLEILLRLLEQKVDGTILKKEKAALTENSELD
jgi:hypothetical protein